MISMAPEKSELDTRELTARAVEFPAGMTLREIEKAVILETLKRQNFNRTRSAEVLGIGIRTLQRKLKQYQGETGLQVLDS